MTGRPRLGPTLDHIVILVSHSALLQVPSLLQTSFIITQGGDHAGGLTTNQLILFEDGTYIEFIAFFDHVDPERRQKHRWGNHPEGTIVDWAYTLPHEAGFAAVQQRVFDTRSGWGYDDPIAGGRKAPDGSLIRWSVGAPRAADGTATPPGRLPFWCLDRTPRYLRVPYEENMGHTIHPCGARGVSRLFISAPGHQLAALSRVYDAIHQPDSNYETMQGWRFEVPSSSDEAKRTVSLLGGDRTEIQLALLGSMGSPSFLELLPGLVVKLEV